MISCRRGGHRETNASEVDEAHIVQIGLHLREGGVALEHEQKRRADRQILAATLASLLQNAFKVTRPSTTILLRTTTSGDRVTIDIEDACGGAAYGLANVVFYGFGEEVGWRGFELPRMQAQFTALTSALLVSCIWAVWRLPLFAFSVGMSSMGLGGAAGWFFSLVTGSILMTWLFNRRRGSVLAVALSHGVLDILMTSPIEGALPFVMGAVITVCGVSLPVFLGRAHLFRRPRVRDPASD